MLSRLPARSTSVGVAALLALTLAPASGVATGAEERPRVVRTLWDPSIVESSGLARSAYSRKRLWTHNDSGGGSTIYAIGRGGHTIAEYDLLGTRHWDWEAMASAKGRKGRNNLFVGEIGDNRRAKSSIFVYRLREPRARVRHGTRTPVGYEFAYPDGPHDAEALLVRPGSLRIYIATKSSGGGHLYVAPRDPSPRRINLLKRIRSVPATITDGVFLDRDRFVLRNYGTGYYYRSLTATPRSFKMAETGESITRGSSRSVLTGSEGRYSKVWRVPY